MRLVIARCTVNYDGRLTAHLPEATRLLMVKADGCVAVHADGGAYKPLNWMNSPNTFVETKIDGVDVWRISNLRDETLLITLHEILFETNQDLGIDPGLQKDGVEAHLQELLAEDPSFLGDNLSLIRREFPTEIGPVDLLCRDEKGMTVAIEVKRRGEIDGIEQLTRYLNFLNRDELLSPVRGVLAAQEIRPQAKILAKDRHIMCIEIDYDELRGIESKTLRLF